MTPAQQDRVAQMAMLAIICVQEVVRQQQLINPDAEVLPIARDTVMWLGLIAPNVPIRAEPSEPAAEQPVVGETLAVPTVDDAPDVAPAVSTGAAEVDVRIALRKSASGWLISLEVPDVAG